MSIKHCNRYFAIPIRTHVITEKDNVVRLARGYCSGVALPGDIICFAESVVSITQRRAVLPCEVKPGRLARFLSRFPAKDGSLATPPAMQLALDEVGSVRVLAGCVAAAVGRVLRKKGLFYRVAGRQLAFIDDIAGTMYPYERHIVMGPREPDKLVKAIKKATRAEAAIVDVNDRKCVDIIGITDKRLKPAVVAALQDNPFGNEDEQTPVVVLKQIKAL